MRYARTIARFLGVALLAVGTSAAAQTTDTKDDNDRRVTVHVVNRNFADVRVYAVAGTARWRIGTVTGLTQEELKLPRYLSGTTEPITLVAYAIGGGGAAASTDLLALPGDEIVFNLEPNFRLSHARLLPRS